MSATRAEARASYAIKAEVRDPHAQYWFFAMQKTMYGGKRIAEGDVVYVFASENQGGSGLISRGIVTAGEPTPPKKGAARQTPRVSITVKRLEAEKRRLGRAQLKPFANWDDGRPETELNFKLYRQATDKIVGIADGTARFLDGFF